MAPKTDFKLAKGCEDRGPHESSTQCLRISSLRHLKSSTHQLVDWLIHRISFPRHISRKRTCTHVCHPSCFTKKSHTCDHKTKNAWLSRFKDPGLLESHPNIWKFIQFAKNEQKKFELKLVQVQTGGHVTKRKPEYVKKEEEILALTNIYINSNQADAVRRFLDQVGLKI